MKPRIPTTSQSPLAYLAALAAGAATVLAFAPFGLWPVQIATLALMFRMLDREAGFRHGALLGWAYGSGWLIAGVHWLYISMHRYGGLPGWMAVLAVILLGAGLSVFMALGTGGAAWLKKRWSLGSTAFLLLVMPAVWTVVEWTRGWIFTGFPWVSSGYAHTNSPLAGYAPLVGVYGLALLSALVAGSIALLPAKKLPLAGAAVLLAAGFGLRGVAWTEPHGSPVTVRLLQGNVPQEMKFQPGQVEATLAQYHGMITEKPADLIATPETAIPLLSTQLPEDYLPLLADFSAATKSHLVIGIPVSDGPRQYSNSVLGIAPGATGMYRYDKHHLVPFGEFIPPGSRWFVQMMNIPLGDFNSAGLLQAPFKVRDQWVLPNICYEDLFGEEIAAQLRASADGRLPEATMLLNVSNIAWFGDSIALPQHLQISQMRSIETGKPMLRSTNTGVTAVIGPTGEVAGQLPPFEKGTLSASVQGFSGLTPYSRYGNIPAVGAAILLLFAARFSGLSRGNKLPNPLETR
ncbi:apolipoprotein N-acyltransferase [Noviherbaspirillum sp.]|uniref:apolipoprotein N-acyltransferase n=1 Tax=Noviherbaspirillum sp. TaxID=1926288 RepID=UPI002D277B76|nr:apolipoprotein N-acyltransferase [Noviherbaspirillum sp.]HZW21521.1 apolipoprotein N-acyltransferase [Noviherbaspirillum sp.]